MIWYQALVTAILIQETGGLERISTITLVLQANRPTNFASTLFRIKTSVSLKYFVNDCRLL